MKNELVVRVNRGKVRVISQLEAFVLAFDLRLDLVKDKDGVYVYKTRDSK